MLGQPQFAIMSLHYLTRNIQSETGAARHRRCVLAAAVALKDQFRLSGGESRAVVANAQLRLPGIGMNIDGDFTGGEYLTALSSRLAMAMHSRPASACSCGLSTAPCWRMFR